MTKSSDGAAGRQAEKKAFKNSAALENSARADCPAKFRHNAIDI